MTPKPLPIHVSVSCVLPSDLGTLNPQSASALALSLLQERQNVWALVRDIAYAKSLIDLPEFRANCILNVCFPDYAEVIP